MFICYIVQKSNNLTLFLRVFLQDDDWFQGLIARWMQC